MTMPGISELELLPKVDPLQEAAANLLTAFSSELGIDTSTADFTDTPARVARMYREVLAGAKNADEQVRAILATAFPCENDQLILVKDIEAFSLCPHHLLPVHYKIHVAYVPKGQVLGISKLARLAVILAQRPVIQEQLVHDISTSLMKIAGVLGSGCIAEGVHYCMAMRGARQSQAKTVTSSLKGIFLENSRAVKQELMELIAR